MAKGFIILENGEDFSVRWTGYDEIIRIAIKELSHLENGSDLLKWLETRVPTEDEDEGDAVFHNRKGEMIPRIIDIRGLTKYNRVLFWIAIENGAQKLSQLCDQYSILNPVVMDSFIEMHRVIVDNIEIIEEDNNYIVIGDDVIEKVGPGWTNNN